MPFVRLIIPLITGILTQFFFNFSPVILLCIGGVVALILLVFYFTSFTASYTYRWVPGFTINALMFVAGSFILYNQDMQHKADWVGHYRLDSIAVMATLQEPLVEKSKTFKALASVDAVNINGQWKTVSGNVLIYFAKNNIPIMNYGSQILFYRPLQAIKIQAILAALIINDTTHFKISFTRFF